MSQVAAAAYAYIPPRFRAGGLQGCVNGQYHGLRAEFSGKFTDQFGSLDGRCVDGNLVGAGADDRARVLQSSDAAAGGQRDGQLGGDAPNRFQERWAAIA